MPTLAHFVTAQVLIKQAYLLVHLPKAFVHASRGLPYPPRMP
jgi:hypothetical protein